MFEKKKCKNCGEKVKDEWQYCPQCGRNLKELDRRHDFFEDAEKEFKKIGKFEFPKDFMRPRGGLTITISSGRPIEIKRRIEPRPIKEIKPEVKRPLRVVKVTEEPETKIENLGGKQIIQIKLPEVKSQDDIEINVLEQSIEIKAFAGNKGYFKLIPIPTNAEIYKKEFKNNILKIEVAK